MIQTGRVSAWSGMSTPAMRMTGTSRTSPIRRSTAPAITAASGARMRGNHTRVTRSRCSTRVSAAAATALETKLQGTSAHSTNGAYGRPSLGTSASRPNTSVKTTIATAGWSTAHATPKKVWR